MYYQIKTKKYSGIWKELDLNLAYKIEEKCEVQIFCKNFNFSFKLFLSVDKVPDRFIEYEFMNF